MKNKLYLAVAAALFVLVVLEFLALIVSAEVSGMRMVHMDRDRTVFVNYRTLVNPAPHVASFWCKIVPAKDGVSYDQMRTALKKAGRNPDRLAYVQILQEMDCTTSASKKWNIVYYDKQDRILHSSALKPRTGELNAFDHATDTVQNAVCITTIRQEERRRDLLASSERLSTNGPASE